MLQVSHIEQKPYYAAESEKKKFGNETKKVTDCTWNKVIALFSSCSSDQSRQLCFGQ